MSLERHNPEDEELVVVYNEDNSIDLHNVPVEITYPDLPESERKNYEVVKHDTISFDMSGTTEQ